MTDDQAVPLPAIEAANEALSKLAERCGMTFLSMYPTTVSKTVLAAAAPHLICCEYDGCDCQQKGAATERERIRQLAETVSAAYRTNSQCGNEDCRCDERAFADLLGGMP